MSGLHTLVRESTRATYRCVTQVLVLCMVVVTICYLWSMRSWQLDAHSDPNPDLLNSILSVGSSGPMSMLLDSENRTHLYHSQTHPFIFIGGHPRSGTTLVRAMLDAHPWVRCGEETRILPQVLTLRRTWSNKAEKRRLVQGGMTDRILDRAVTALLTEAIVQHGRPARVLCDKDPLLLSDAKYITGLFPKSKWVFMVRDGRAVVHSILSRKITITGYNNKDPQEALESWNNLVESMNEQCSSIGSERCILVRYEQLVLHPRKTMERLLGFLGLPWEETVLHHEQFINQDGDNGIKVSNRERSSDQVVKPINIAALTQWVGTFPTHLVESMGQVAPMLARLGYDPDENPPLYGEPDDEVWKQTQDLEEHKDDWSEKVKKLLAGMEKKI